MINTDNASVNVNNAEILHDYCRIKMLALYIILNIIYCVAIGRLKGVMSEFEQWKEEEKIG